MRMRPGSTLIELMVAVAIFGIVAATAGSVYGVLGAPGRPGHTAYRIDQAREVLVEALEEARSTPFADLSEHADQPAQAWNSRVPGIRITRAVHSIDRDLLHIELVASWHTRGKPHELLLVGLRGDSGW